MTKIQEKMLEIIGNIPINIPDLVDVMSVEMPGIAERTIKNNASKLKKSGLIGHSKGLYFTTMKAEKEHEIVELEENKSIGSALDIALMPTTLDNAKYHAEVLTILLDKLVKTDLDEPEIIAALNAVIKYHE